MQLACPAGLRLAVRRFLLQKPKSNRTQKVSAAKASAVSLAVVGSLAEKARASITSPPPPACSPHRHDSPLRRVSGQIPKALIRHLNQPVMLQGTGSDNDHARRRVVRGDVVLKLLPGEAAHVLRRTEDGASKTTLLEAHLVQVVQYHLFTTKSNGDSRWAITAVRLYRCEM